MQTKNIKMSAIFALTPICRPSKKKNRSLYFRCCNVDSVVLFPWKENTSTEETGVVYLIPSPPVQLFCTLPKSRAMCYSRSKIHDQKGHFPGKMNDWSTSKKRACGCV